MARASRLPSGWPAVLAGLLFGGIGAGLLVAAAARFLEAPPLLLAGFGAIFLGGGLLIAFQGWRSAQRARQVALHPAEPWRFDHGWDPGGALDETGASARRAIASAALTAAFLLPFNALAATRPDDFPLPMALFLDLAPLALLARGLFLLARRRRHGISRLRFHRFPYLLAEPFEATLVMGQRAPLVRALEVTLSCVEKRPEEVMGEGSVETRWVEVELCRATQTMRGARELPLRFELPSDGRDLGTDLVSAADRRWTLRVKGQAPGMNYDARFLLPVYAAPREEAAAWGSGRRDGDAPGRANR